MTCVVGIKDDSVVYMGCDSAGTDGCDVRTLNNPKVFKKSAHGVDYIFGFTGSYRMGQIIQYSFCIPSYSSGVDPMEHMVQTFIPSLLDCFKENGYAYINNSVVSGGTFLIGFRGALFEVQDSFQVIEHRAPYVSIGCGKSYALGALHCIYGIEEPFYGPKDAINITLQAAEEFSSGVRGPFVFEKV